MKQSTFYGGQTPYTESEMAEKIIAPRWGEDTFYVVHQFTPSYNKMKMYFVNEGSKLLYRSSTEQGYAKADEYNNIISGAILKDGAVYGVLFIKKDFWDV